LLVNFSLILVFYIKMNKKIDLSQIKRILIVRLDGIGDVVLTTPFLRELRRNLPKAWITLIIKPEVYNLMELCPYVNEVLVFNYQMQGRLQRVRIVGRIIKFAWKYLWWRRFDLAIVPRWGFDYYRASWLVYFSGARWRVGFKQAIPKGYERFFTHLVDEPRPKHWVQYSLDLLRWLGGTVRHDHLEVWCSDEDEAFAEMTLVRAGVSRRDVVVAICPGAGAPKRVWPLHRFAELGRWLQEEWGVWLLLIGGKDERAIANELQERVGGKVINMVGKTTLRQTASLLRRCALFIGGDTGPMHIAAAVGVPVIELSCHPKSGAILHDNSPKHFAPWGVPHIVLQPAHPLPPCTDGCNANEPHCILQITVEEVKRATREMLEYVSQRRRQAKR
jgi:heptosyltransferase-2